MSSVSCTTNKLLVTNTMATTAATKLLKFQNIAPAPPHASEESKLRKYTQRSVPYNNDQTQSVLRRNARERNRVKQVNNSFARLRQHIPQTIIADLTKGGGRGPHKKISKVDTLRIAVEYIRRLQDLLDDLNGFDSHVNSRVVCMMFACQQIQNPYALRTFTYVQISFATTTHHHHHYYRHQEELKYPKGRWEIEETSSNQIIIIACLSYLIFNRAILGYKNVILERACRVLKRPP
ncbi:hypothetical protein GQX74_007465 [Glossina fuscipes]|nr:hypothetical protein GQX74_007465 [Glossina fuscipes]